MLNKITVSQKRILKDTAGLLYLKKVFDNAENIEYTTTKSEIDLSQYSSFLARPEVSSVGVKKSVYVSQILLQKIAYLSLQAVCVSQVCAAGYYLLISYRKKTCFANEFDWGFKAS